MLFLLQKENKKYDLDNFILRNLIEENKYIHRFIDMSLNDFYDEKKQLKTIELFPKEYKEAIPLGTIQFVNAYFQTFFHLTMNALEIPKVLLKDEFLERKYSIRVADDIPTKGNYFIKDATELKRFSYEGELEYLYLIFLLICTFFLLLFNLLYNIDNPFII